MRWHTVHMRYRVFCYHDERMTAACGLQASSSSILRQPPLTGVALPSRLPPPPRYHYDPTRAICRPLNPPVCACVCGYAGDVHDAVVLSTVPYLLHCANHTDRTVRTSDPILDPRLEQEYDCVCHGQWALRAQVSGSLRDLRRQSCRTCCQCIATMPRLTGCHNSIEIWATSTWRRAGRQSAHTAQPARGRVAH